MTKTLLVLLTLGLLTACTTVEDNTAKSSPAYAISSVNFADFNVSQFNGFHIEGVIPKNIQQHVSFQQRQYAYQLISNWLTKQLNDQGLKPAAHPYQQGVLSIKFALASFDELNDQELAKRFGIAPGLDGIGAEQKVTLGVVLKQGEMDLWKGAVQGIPSQGLTAEQRQQRLENVLAMLTNKVLAK